MTGEATGAAGVVGVQIRPVRPAEFDAAGEVTLAAYRALAGAHLSGDYAAELADVRRRCTEAEVLVAVTPAGTATGGVLGCVTFVADHASPWAEYLEPGESSIRMLAVDPAAQGQGGGNALLQACVQRARHHSSRALMLHSTPWMTTAHRLYRRAGFERVPERDWLPMPEVPLWAFRLALAVSPAGT